MGLYKSTDLGSSPSSNTKPCDFGNLSTLRTWFLLYKMSVISTTPSSFDILWCYAYFMTSKKLDFFFISIVLHPMGWQSPAMDEITF